ncbi:hypothetical protein V039C_0043 [Vibrio phage V039C]|nr:hypothetical protein V039C_0043 [Vibrio phage V039C]
MELIEPKEIELTSGIHGIKKKYRLGLYPALEGLRLFGLLSEAVDSGVRKKTKDVTGLFGDNLKNIALEVCQYVDVKLENGSWQKLENEPLINAHVLDYEMLAELVREVHDFNSKKLATTTLLKTSLTLMDQVKHLATKMFTQLSESSSAKNKRRSKS